MHLNTVKADGIQVTGHGGEQVIRDAEIGKVVDLKVRCKMEIWIYSSIKETWVHQQPDEENKWIGVKGYKSEETVDGDQNINVVVEVYHCETTKNNR